MACDENNNMNLNGLGQVAAGCEDCVVTCEPVNTTEIWSVLKNAPAEGEFYPIDLQAEQTICEVVSPDPTYSVFDCTELESAINQAGMNGIAGLNDSLSALNACKGQNGVVRLTPNQMNGLAGIGAVQEGCEDCQVTCRTEATTETWYVVPYAVDGAAQFDVVLSGKRCFVSSPSMSIDYDCTDFETALEQATGQNITMSGLGGCSQFKPQLNGLGNLRADTPQSDPVQIPRTCSETNDWFGKLFLGAMFGIGTYAMIKK